MYSLAGERGPEAWPASDAQSGPRGDHRNDDDRLVNAALLLVAGLLVAILAQFALEPLADRNDLVHWIQHGLIFWSGVAVGFSLVLLYRRGQRRA